MIFILRIIADILWQIKPLNVLVNLFLLFVIPRSIKNGKLFFPKKAKNILLIVVILLGLFIFSFFKNINVLTIKVIFKISFSFLMFFYGIIHRGDLFKDIKRLEKISIFFIILFFVLSFFDFSYEYWGNVRTFNGLYYFKTDMALAIIIFLSFILLSKRFNNRVKVIFVLISVYMVYLTNARIHILSIFFIVGLAILGEGLFKNFKRKFFFLLPIAIFSFVVALQIYNSMAEKKGLIKIEISGEGAETSANLQGRNKIWLALLYGYSNATVEDQLLGMGLDEDIKMVAKFSEDDTHNSHNGYLFMLISIGALGLFFFLFFYYLIIYRFVRITNYYTKMKNERQLKNTYIVLNLSLVHFFVFFIANLTNSSILFQQQTWFFMFFAGYLFNNYFIYNNVVKEKNC